MFCMKCGSKIPDESVFCPFCGADLKAMAATAAPEQNVVPEQNVSRPSRKLKVFSIVGMALTLSALGGVAFLIFAFVIFNVGGAALKLDFYQILAPWFIWVSVILLIDAIPGLIFSIKAKKRWVIVLGILNLVLITAIICGAIGMLFSLFRTVVNYSR